MLHRYSFTVERFDHDAATGSADNTALPRKLWG
jgi:hypothetical protein